MRFFKSVKFRLTLWYLIVIVILLAAFSGAANFMLSQNLRQHLDDSLQVRTAELRTTFAFEGGRFIFAAQPGDLVLLYDNDAALLQRFGTQVEFNNISDAIKQVLQGQNLFMTATASDGQEYRLYGSQLIAFPRTRIAIILGRPTSDINSVLATFRYVSGISGLTVIILAAVGGLFLAGRALKPVDRITRTAQEIGESDLRKRIDVHGEDEIGRLAGTLNQMIARLERAFDRQRQFTADASHELRTPLAVMEAESTLALSRERSEPEYRKSLELISQEITYMSAIIGKLLFLARSDAGKEPLNLEDVELNGLLTELAIDVEVLAKEKELQFVMGPLENVSVKGDRVKLRQLFLNILENAVRYTPQGGRISASVTRNSDLAIVTISDTGIGIPPEHLPHMFERFYRVDKARSRAEGGTGLGLAIARSIAEAHGGKIELASESGKGSTFRVLLPFRT